MGIKTFLKNYNRYIDKTSMLSDLDHILTSKSPSDRLLYIRDIEETDIDYMDKPVKVFLAGVIECIYNENKVKLPDWINKDLYKFNDVTEDPTYEGLYKLIFRASEEERIAIIHKIFENSLPEFKHRNCICNSIFDSY